MIIRFQVKISCTFGVKNLKLFKESDSRCCDLAGTFAIVSLHSKCCWDLRFPQEYIQEEANGPRLG